MFLYLNSGNNCHISCPTCLCDTLGMVGSCDRRLEFWEVYPKLVLCLNSILHNPSNMLLSSTKVLCSFVLLLFISIMPDYICKTPSYFYCFQQICWFCGCFYNKHMVFLVHPRSYEESDWTRSILIQFGKSRSGLVYFSSHVWLSMFLDTEIVRPGMNLAWGQSLTSKMSWWKFAK